MTPEELAAIRERSQECDATGGSIEPEMQEDRRALLTEVDRLARELADEQAKVQPVTMDMEDLDPIIEHLINDGTRDGLILGDKLNWAMGRSARRRRALDGPR